ncbi:MAG: sugar phosphate isomerase/epimerase [Woeseiaceae bacterium]|nr:sugar phosphate isomerase/epimerase [Woeseiaceae bacterium]
MSDPTVNRREFLAAAAAGVVAGCGPAGTAGPAVRRQPGVQLYTVRDAMAEDVAATLQAIAGIGYKEVEFAGYFDRSPLEIRALLERFGLAAPSAHIDRHVARDDPATVAGRAAEAGHDYAIIAWLAPEERTSIADYQRWAEVANRLGEACRPYGLRAAYHNHEFEFEPIGSRVPYDVLLAETEPSLVDFELDFYWVQKAGHEVRDVLALAPERFVLAHIKDMDTDGNITEVGAGTIDFAGILADPVAASIRHCYAEHDRPADPFRSVAFSHYALRSILD